MNESFLQEISEPIKNSLRKEDASEDENYSDKVAYITDIHLLHRYDLYQCETAEDRHLVVQNIAEKIGGFLPKTKIKLLGGDISSNFKEYQAFISALSPYANKDYWDASDFFFTLGNHDLWSFPEEDFSSIEKHYRELLSKHKMYLVQNNLYYYDNYYTLLIRKKNAY